MPPLVPWLLAVAGAATPASAPRVIVLVTVDTLRADRLGAYGYTRPTSPFLDRLAREGALFQNAFSSAAHTSPAHAALFTGLHPSQSGVRSNGQGFGDAAGYETLAELLGRAGYESAAVSAVNFLKPITRGFHEVRVGDEVKSYRTADETVDRALEWLGGRRPGQRIFLWLHLFDPHLPDRAPPETKGALAFASKQIAQNWAEALLLKRPTAVGAYRTPLGLAARHSAYDAEVAFADRELQRLFERTQAARLNESALWIVTADHGEGLGDHGYDGHGPFLYDEALHVPLIMWSAGRFAGVRVASLARLVDLLPTLAEWTGTTLRPLAGFTRPGRSLLPVLREPERPLPPAFAFAQRRPPGPKLRDYEPGEVFALRTLEYKYIVRTAAQDELYDVRADPLEATNLAGRPPAARQSLERLAREAFAQATREGSRSEARPASPDSEEELRALGYVQ